MKSLKKEKFPNWEHGCGFNQIKLMPGCSGAANLVAIEVMGYVRQNIESPVARAHTSIHIAFRQYIKTEVTKQNEEP